jgi:SSS family transporter
MVLAFVIVYMVVTVTIGLLASRLVKNSNDYILAGRRLPLYMSATALFATWFGAETMLGASSRINEEGLLGTIEDPFGAALCLLLLGVFFAKPLYRSGFLTFGDFFRARYDRKAEIISSVFIVISYFGWVAAQIVALGLVFHVITGLSFMTALLVSSSVLILYTFFGGWWAVSINDFMQTIMIIVALIVVFVVLADQAGGVGEVLGGRDPDFYKLWPKAELVPILEYLTAWMAIGLGSIPQQDLFQRVCSAKDEKTAVRACYVGSGMYLTVAFMPLFIAMAVKTLHPELLELPDHQLILPTLIRLYTNEWVQIFFWGALLSAILSTASAAILAPSVILSENLIRPLLPKLTDKKFLWLTRGCVLFISTVAILFSLPQDPTAADAATAGLPMIWELVAESYTSTLVALLVPLTAGIYWKRANTRGAFAAMVSGLAVWALFNWGLELDYAAKIAGFLASIAGMVLGSLSVPPQPAGPAATIENAAA